MGIGDWKHENRDSNLEIGNSGLVRSLAEITLMPPTYHLRPAGLPHIVRRIHGFV